MVSWTAGSAHPVAYISRMLSVSQKTVRDDLVKLASLGLVIKKIPLEDKGKEMFYYAIPSTRVFTYSPPPTPQTKSSPATKRSIFDQLD